LEELWESTRVTGSASDALTFSHVGASTLADQRNRILAKRKNQLKDAIKKTKRAWQLSVAKTPDDPAHFEPSTCLFNVDKGDGSMGPHMEPFQRPTFHQTIIDTYPDFVYELPYKCDKCKMLMKNVQTEMKGKAAAEADEEEL